MKILAIALGVVCLPLLSAMASDDSPGPITVSPKALATEPAIGKIIGYNRQWGFAIANVGVRKGVKTGTRLAIRRDDEVIIVGIVEESSAAQSVIGFTHLRPDGIDNNRPHLGDQVFVYPPKSR